MDSILASASGKKRDTPPGAVNLQAQKPKDEKVLKPRVASTFPSPMKKKPNDMIARAVKIITEEVGVDQTELSDGSLFAELGIDSLLSLTITGKMREILNIEVASTLFDDCPTLKDLKRYLRPNDEVDEVSNPTSDDSTSANNSTAISTPDLISLGLDTESASSAPGDDDATVYGDNKMVNLIRTTIAAEMDMEPGEINSSTDLVELGMDSLMSLSVLSKLREETNEEIPSDFFAENTTFKAIEQHYGVKQVLTPSHLINRKTLPQLNQPEAKGVYF